MNLETISYGGWDNCLRLTNGTIELVATLDVGPRIIRFGFVDGQNLFHTFADSLGKTGGEEWESYGGHRLWHAPEVMPRTYYPDNHPVQHDWDGTTLTLTPPEEATNHLQLSIAVTMDPEKPLVTLRHRIRNTHVWDTELAPWCLSVMATGGRAIFPQEHFIPHPDQLVPARPLVRLGRRTAPDRGPGPGGTRSESNRAPLHRGRRGTVPVRRPAPRGPRQQARVGRAR